ncbi:MAG: bifunctional diaminohydroxyphosphoribosylaminopyrimidine deaminase/5-amino-6-(5-phosphoribosylamino)uracil reductase RibD, partial [Chloroflexota bacterium]
LEPCSHWGRTPPCVEAIIKAGIRRVVIAMLDPYPEADGRGVQLLEKAGVNVETGCRDAEAREHIAGFTSRIQRGRPAVTVKYAMTLDGRIATRTGHSRWVSGTESRELVHQLRDRSDAILVGIGTALADDPQLTTRLPDELAGYGGPHHPLRVVLDGNLRLPPDAKMLSDDVPGDTLIYTTPDAGRTGRAAALREAGADVATAPLHCGRIDLWAVLEDLGERDVNDMLIEGGGSVLGSFFDRGLVDRVMVFIAPLIVGGKEAPSPVGGAGVNTMPDAWKLRDRRITQLGDDILVEGWVEHPGECGHV